MSTYSSAALAKRLPIATMPIFVVGAGGIGCELLKNLVLIGFRNIEVIDLDTIDASNLNRQFLFRKEHVGRSKSQVAGEVLMEWCKNITTVGGRSVPLTIKAHHGNVKSSEYDVDFYKKFKIVMNGLDNMSARKHVNRMCMQAGIPLVESGTMGYNGQVQPIVKGVFQCYDCEPKPADQKTFAVCTIHARPTTMVHCVHYAKEFYARAFGENVAAAAAAEQNGATAGESEMAFLDGIVNGDGATRKDVSTVGPELCKMLFETKVKELLSMKTEWTITPPVSIDTDAMLADAEKQALPGMNDSEPTLSQVVKAFVHSVNQCTARGRKPFTKDDDVAVAMVAACANLRAHCFHIKRQSIFDIRTIAGSIVPAIASTNAVIAACVVSQSLQLLATQDQSELKQHARYVYLRSAPQTRRRAVKLHRDGSVVKVKDQYLLHGNAPQSPNASCYVCSGSTLPMKIRLNAKAHTLNSFVKLVLLQHLSFVCPSINDTVTGNTIYEMDEFDDLGGEPLTRWLKVDGDGAGVPCQWTISDLYQDVEWGAIVEHSALEFGDETQFEVKVVEATTAGAATTGGEDGSGRDQVQKPTTGDGDDDVELTAYHPSKKKQRTILDRPATAMRTETLAEAVDIVQIE